MKKTDKKTKKKQTKKKLEGPESTKGKRPDEERAQPAAHARSNEIPVSERTDAPSPEEVISHYNKPVTNQDEQDKITNAGRDDIPVADK